MQHSASRPHLPITPGGQQSIQFYTPCASLAWLPGLNDASCASQPATRNANAPNGGDPDPEMRDRLKAIESAVLAMTGKCETTEKTAPLPPPKPSGEPCHKWNAGNCTYPRCRHTHACSSCGGPPHPVIKCLSQNFAISGPQVAGKHFRPQSRPY